MMNTKTNLDNFTTVGIDVSKQNLDVFISPTGEVMRVANDPRGHAKILKKLNEHSDIFRIVMEHTGGYQKQIASFLQSHNHPVSVVNPAHPRHFAKSSGIRAKTDTMDAELLARFGAMQRPPEDKPLSKTAEILKELVCRRDRLNGLITQENNALEKKPSLMITKSIKRSLKTLEKERNLMDKEIQSLIKSDDDLQKKSALLCQEKGIGLISAAALLAYMPELGTMGRRQVAALAGLAPINRDSGKKSGHAFIQAGRKSARCALYMPALVAIRYNPILRDQYLRLTERGKQKKVAITAVMRKMLVHLNSVINKNFYKNENYT